MQTNSEMMQNFVLFRRFSDGLTSQDKHDTLVLLIEASVIMLGIMIMTLGVELCAPHVQRVLKRAAKVKTWTW